MILTLLIAATVPLTVAYMAARHIEAIQRSWYRPSIPQPGDDWGDERREH
jgi:hypothetical protein